MKFQEHRYTESASRRKRSRKRPDLSKKGWRRKILFFGIVLFGYACFTLYDAFLLPKKIQQPPDNAQAETTALIPGSQQFTDTSYQDDHISIVISKERFLDSDVTIADVKLSDPSLLKAGLAGGVFGRNITDNTSTIASECGAIFAVNGDFYGFRDDGIVMRNSFLYRNVPRTDPASDVLLIDGQGNLSICPDSAVTDYLINASVQIISFGPGLVENGSITENAMAASERNPRTAIGQVEPLHYIFVTVDGRTTENAGMFLTDLAGLMKSLGCQTAYNLDGGGSTAMWFMGKVLNTPADGHKLGERKVSDIVYIGY